MSVGYKAVQWNRQKFVYDAILVACVALFIATFMSLMAYFEPPSDKAGWVNIRLRAFGACAFLMITLIVTSLLGAWVTWLFRIETTGISLESLDR